MSRRQWLEALSLLGLVVPVVGGCSSENSPAPALGHDVGANVDGAADVGSPEGEGALCGEGLPEDPHQWLEVPLSSMPAGVAPRGVIIDDDVALVHVWIVELGGGCHRAIWKICTHGACEVRFDPPNMQLVCPCHGSRFALDGSVLQGPAVRPLRVLEVRRGGASLWVKRPFV